ncbi:MAG TPA: hypothetical protein VM370_13060 [Candidatus Thermoplasmatota archaeon]|nr:hypothetical protein [Candidatus Thermoplasmatota archaeon]
MFRRQAAATARGQEETISEDLLANIPVVGAQADAVFETLDEEVIVMPPPASSPHARDPTPESAPASDAVTSPLAQQLRYELGEAFARELDRAEQSLHAALTDMEARLAAAETALAQAKGAADKERAARLEAEARLKAFKELALR